MRTFKVKDFEIRSFRCGSRLQNGAEWAYAIYYNAANGKQVRLNKVCYTKKAAEQYVRETIKLAELLKANKEG